MSDIHWYPGHMTKAVREMKEDIRLIDIMIEIIDARIPVSSRNPDIDSLANNKSRIIILNKSDLADDAATDTWIKKFTDAGIIAVKTNARSGNGIRAMKDAIAKASAEKIERDRKRGILNRPVRAMVAGIPNVGKSTFINSYAGKNVAKTGNKPGVTRGKQWIRLNKQVELLDTPGILWPKFDDRVTAKHLAYIGSMKNEVVNIRELAFEFIDEMNEDYPDMLLNVYMQNSEISDKEDIRDMKSEDFLTAVAQKRGFLLKGGSPDIDKAAALILDDFKNGRIGKITLEKA